MYITYCIFAAFTSIVMSSGQHQRSKLDRLPSDDSDEEPNEKPEADNHTFVALIDVVFNDGARRSCTGTIIHDNVVITAGHCFIKETYYGDKVDAELTASFVVIGTKKMFESGYEQYLPIEKVIAHPKYKGWTADLALVFTFAGMTSDKPGTVVPLAGDRTSTPVDSNATVLSWGHCKDYEIKNKKTTLPSSDSSCEDSSDEHSNDEIQDDHPDKNRKGTKSSPLNLDSSSIEEVDFPGFSKPKKARKEVRTTGYKGLRIRKITTQRKMNSRLYRHRAVKTTTTKKRLSRYLASNENNLTKRSNRRSEKQKQLKSYYKNWRRRMGTSQNKLTAEVFGFVNVQACKKLIEKATATIYHSNGNDIVCYASEDHYITDEDAGAPAIQAGYLVAVTVGGVECEGEHVAVGMKMSCYCSWILKNLPENVHINCCKDCCDVYHTVSSSAVYRKHRNKYLL